MAYTVRVLSVLGLTHDVLRIRVSRPPGYQFSPGEATELAINKQGWQEEKRPFTFTSLGEDPWLEFTIKCYEDHRGVTGQLRLLAAGDELIIGEPWGAISYKGSGCFIAGGAGITPFLAILRRLHQDGQMDRNVLFFSNKTEDDIICEQELREMLGENVYFLSTRISGTRHPSGRIDAGFLKKHVKDYRQYFYVCGPDPMVAEINRVLREQGAGIEAVVFEQ